MHEQLSQWHAKVREGRKKARKVATKSNAEQVEIPPDFSFKLFKLAVLFLLWEGWKIKITAEEFGETKTVVKITQKYTTIRKDNVIPVSGFRLNAA